MIDINSIKIDAEESIGYKHLLRSKKIHEIIRFADQDNEYIEDSINNMLSTDMIPMNINEAYEIIRRSVQRRWFLSQDIEIKDIELTQDNLVAFLKEDSNTMGNFYVKVKTNNKELLELAVNKNLIVNKGTPIPTATEQVNGLTNMQKFIKYNAYKTLGKSTYDYESRELKVKEFLDKDGNKINLKQGMLYKCACGAYEIIEQYEAYLCFSVLNDQSICSLKECVIMNVTCASCKEVTDMEHIAYRHTINNYNGIIAKNIFNDIEEKGKLTIGNLSKTIKFYGDTYSSATYSHKVVFNLDTGRSYSLPVYNVNTKKTKGALRQFGADAYSIQSTASINLKDAIICGELMQQYISTKVDRPKAIIPFVDYIKKGLKSMYHAFNENAIDDLYEAIHLVCEEQENELLKIYKGRLASFNSYDLLSILASYNQNPYIDYNSYREICFLQKDVRINNISPQEYAIPKKVYYTKRLRQMNLLSSMNNVFNIKSKKEKQFISQASYSVSAFVHLNNVKQALSNVDNINKILDANSFYYTSKKVTFLSNYVRIDNNQYLQDLIKTFGETTVVNALTKDLIKYNKQLEEHYDKYGSYNTYSLDASRVARNDSLYRDTIHNYETIKKVYPEYTFPCDRLRLKELHDKIAKDASKIRHKKKDYEYDEKLMKLYHNKQINNITFNVALSNRRLTDVGSKMCICVGGYSRSVENGVQFIVYMTQDNEYVGCLEITRDGYLIQAKAKYNRQLTDEQQEALKVYCEMTNTETKTGDISEEYAVKRDSKKEYISYKDEINIKVSMNNDIKEILESDDDELEAMPLRQIADFDNDAIPF